MASSPDGGSRAQHAARGRRVLRGSPLARRALVGLGLLPRDRVDGDARRRRGDRHGGAGPAVGAGLDARRLAARRLAQGLPRAAALARRRGDRARRPVGDGQGPPQRHGRRRARPRLRRQLRLRPDGGRGPCADRPDPDRPGRRGDRRGERPVVPERHGDHPRRRHADRRRDGRGALHAVLGRRGRHAGRPRGVGADRAGADLRLVRADAGRAEVRPRRLRARRRGLHLVRRRGRRARRAAGARRRDRRRRARARRASASSRACSAARTAARCCSAQRPTSSSTGAWRRARRCWSPPPSTSRTPASHNGVRSCNRASRAKPSVLDCKI